MPVVFAYLWGFEEQFSLVHGDFEGARLWSTEEDDVLVRERLQRLGFSSFVDGHVLSTDAQPQVVREASFFTLQRFKNTIKVRLCVYNFGILHFIRPGNYRQR